MNSPQQITGVDIGGTKISAVPYDVTDSGLEQSGDEVKILTAPDKITESLKKCILGANNGKTPGAVGIGWPGDVDEETGLIYSGVNVNNIGTKDAAGFNLVKPLQDIGVQDVSVLNDADAQLLAAVDEQREETKNAVVLGLGTGLGAGVLVNGDILWSSELGHITTDIGDPSTRLENVVSGPGLERMFNEAGIEGRLPGIMNFQGEHENFKETLEKFQRHFATVVSNVAFVYRPEKIFVSGGLGERLIKEDSEFLYNVEETARGILDSKGFQRIASNLNVHKMPCDDAGTRGAALYAQRQHNIQA